MFSRNKWEHRLDTTPIFFWDFSGRGRCQGYGVREDVEALYDTLRIITLRTDFPGFCYGRGRCQGHGVGEDVEVLDVELEGDRHGQVLAREHLSVCECE